MNILVVDDEYYIVQGIVQTIDKAKLGITEVFTAYSLNQAQKVFKKHQIEILLTDIEMPKGSGLELVRWSCDEGYNPVILFLTGHQNFDYVHKAIKFQCLDYLLKPIKSIKLETHLARAVDEVKKRNRQNRNENLAEYWNSNKSTRIELFWSRVLTDNIPPNPDKIQTILEQLQLPMDWLNTGFYLCLFKFCDTNSISDSHSGFNSLIRKILSKHCLTTPHSIVMTLTDAMFLAPVPSEHVSEYKQLCTVFEKVLSDIMIQTPFTVSIYIPEKCTITEAVECLKTLKKIEMNIRTVGSRIVPVKILQSDSISGFSENFPDIQISRWSEYLLQYNTDLIIKELRKLLHNGYKYYSSRILVSLYYGIIQTSFSSFSKANIDTRVFFPQISSYDDLQEAVSSINNFFL